VISSKTVFVTEQIRDARSVGRQMSRISSSSLPPSRNLSGIRLKSPNDRLKLTKYESLFWKRIIKKREQSRLISGPDVSITMFL